MPHTRIFSCRIARGAAPWADMSGEPPKKRRSAKHHTTCSLGGRVTRVPSGKAWRAGQGNGKRISAHPSAKKVWPPVRDTISTQCLPAKAPRGRPAESIHEVPSLAIRADGSLRLADPRRYSRDGKRTPRCLAECCGRSHEKASRRE